MANDKQGATGFLGQFTVLGGAMRELWIVFAVKLLGTAAYSLTNSTLKLWLSSDFGYSDQKALGLVTSWTVILTVVTLLVGSLTDAIGLRKTFFLGVWVCIVARAVMTFTSVRWLALICGLAPLAVGEALGTPVLIAGVRRYSTTAQRSIAFSLSYTVMNVGFLLASFIFDFVRQGMGEYGHFSLLGFSLSTYRTLFFVSFLIELSMLPILYFLRDGVEAADASSGVAVEQPVCARCGYNLTGNLSGRCPECGTAIATKAGAQEIGFWRSLARTVTSTFEETIRLFGNLVRQPGFYRLLSFLMLIAFLKLIMMFMSYVYPSFGIRELGPGAPVGRLWGINSLLIIFLVPVVGALTQRIPAYPVVIIGSIITAAAVSVMALPTSWFEPLAANPVTYRLMHWYLGLQGSIHPYYVMIAFFVLLLSIGEAFFSPRVYEYAAAIAPKGQEASYGALSYVPFLLAKLLTGTIGGLLLARYCPEQGPRNSQTMWMVVALMTAIAPIGLILLRHRIRVHEAGRES